MPPKPALLVARHATGRYNFRFIHFREEKAGFARLGFEARGPMLKAGATASVFTPGYWRLYSYNVLLLISALLLMAFSG